MSRISKKAHKSATDLSCFVVIVAVIAITILAGMDKQIPTILTVIASTAGGAAVGLPLIPAKDEDGDDEGDETGPNEEPRSKPRTKK